MRLDCSLRSVARWQYIPFPDGSGKVACHITGSVGGWCNQVEWMMLSGVSVGKVLTIR